MLMDQTNIAMSLYINYSAPTRLKRARFMESYQSWCWICLINITFCGNYPVTLGSTPTLRSYILLNTQPTQNICITFVQCRPNVFDVGPTLYKCYTSVLVFTEYVCSDRTCVHYRMSGDRILHVYMYMGEEKHKMHLWWEAGDEKFGSTFSEFHTNSLVISI